MQTYEQKWEKDRLALWHAVAEMSFDPFSLQQVTAKIKDADTAAMMKARGSGTRISMLLKSLRCELVPNPDAVSQRWFINGKLIKLYRRTV